MTNAPIFISSKEQAEDFIDQYDNFLFDCDGVIWLDENIIPKVLDFVKLLDEKNKQYAFVTNNSSKSRKSYIGKFARLGFKDVTEDKIFPTCYSAASTLKNRLKIASGSKIWVLGDTGIEEELVAAGYVPVGGSDARLNVDFDMDHELLQVDPDVKAVVVGSTKEFNYMRIATSLQYLLHNDKALPFVGCNIDRTYPAGDGIILPAGGSVVNYMKYTAHRDFVDVGKPSGVFLQAVLDKTGFQRDRTVMVGDTLYTDIKFGNDGKLGGSSGGSLLVLSGGTKSADLKRLLHDTSAFDEGETLVPLYYIESLGHLFELTR